VTRKKHLWTSIKESAFPQVDGSDVDCIANVDTRSCFTTLVANISERFERRPSRRAESVLVAQAGLHCSKLRSFSLNDCRRCHCQVTPALMLTIDAHMWLRIGARCGVTVASLCYLTSELGSVWTLRCLSRSRAACRQTQVHNRSRIVNALEKKLWYLVEMPSEGHVSPIVTGTTMTSSKPYVGFPPRYGVETWRCSRRWVGGSYFGSSW